MFWRQYVDRKLMFSSSHSSVPIAGLLLWWALGFADKTSLPDKMCWPKVEKVFFLVS